MAERSLSDERQAAWSRLWAQGGAGSFHDPAGGDLPLRTHWQEWFAGLPPDARVLDIATGNGILPRWLIEAHTTATCDAVDRADIRPRWHSARVQFHPLTSAEHLPWNEALFDAVVSQFGVEYGDLAVIFEQLTRVSRPSAALQLVMHHVDSHPVRLAAEEVTHAEWLRVGGWFVAARAMVEPMSLLHLPDGPKRLALDPRLNDIRRRFDAVQAERQHRADRSASPDLLEEVAQATARAFQQAAHVGRHAGLDALADLERHVSDSHTRLVEMQASALDEAEIEAAQRLLHALGWQMLSPQRWYERNHLMGWALQGQFQSR